MVVSFLVGVCRRRVPGAKVCATGTNATAEPWLPNAYGIGGFAPGTLRHPKSLPKVQKSPPKEIGELSILNFILPQHVSFH